MVSFRTNCLAAWELTLVEPAQKITVSVTTSQPAADDAAPVIDAPATVQTNGPVIELTGRVSDSSAITEFTVNGAAASLQAGGGFYIKRGVAQGQSELVIAALDEWGNRAERRVQVTRKIVPVTQSADTGRAKAAGSEFDGRWSLYVSAGKYACYSKEARSELVNDAAPIDLLLTDVVLPGAMSGPDLATEILRRSPAIKKLYMTGYAEAAFSSQHELDSETPVLQKPFKMAELAATIRGVLDGP